MEDNLSPNEVISWQNYFTTTHLSPQQQFVPNDLLRERERERERGREREREVERERER